MGFKGFSGGLMRSEVVSVDFKGISRVSVSKGF